MPAKADSTLPLSALLLCNFTLVSAVRVLLFIGARIAYYDAAAHFLCNVIFIMMDIQNGQNCCILFPGECGLNQVVSLVSSLTVLTLEHALAAGDVTFWWTTHWLRGWQKVIPSLEHFVAGLSFPPGHHYETGGVLKLQWCQHVKQIVGHQIGPSPMPFFISVFARYICSFFFLQPNPLDLRYGSA